MKILISGAGGLIGSHLIPFLAHAGHHVIRLVRRAPQGAHESWWDPDAERMDAAPLETADAIIHLAGKNLADARWTPPLKKQFYTSRVKGTHLLALAAAKSKHPPKVMLTASAIGYYGDCGDTLLTEAADPGKDFLATLCRDWEAAASPAAERGIRVVCTRIGIVLSPEGGALKQMLPIFRAGLGGPLGPGRQFMSWIHIQDILGAMAHALETPDLGGPVNLVAPHPVTNREFTRTLGRTLGRPSFLSAPAPALRFAFGQMADAALLSSARVAPARLLHTGYAFRFPDLPGALAHLLPRS